MRTRERQLPEIWSGVTPYQSSTYYWNDTKKEWWLGGSNTSTASSKLVGGGSEVILDDPTGGRYAKPVTHYKRRWQIVNEPTSFEYETWKSSGIPSRPKNVWECPWATWHSVGRGDFPIADFRNCRVEYPLTSNQLIQQAVHGFYDSNQVDNLTNIMEVGQTIALSRQVLQALRHASVLFTDTNGRRVKKSLQTFVTHVLRKNGAAISSAYLAWNFGVMPLARDLVAMAKSVKTLRSKMDHAVANSGKVSRSSALCGGILSPDLAGVAGFTSTSKQPDLLGGYLLNSHILFNPTRRATVRGVRTIRYKTAGFGYLDYLLNRFLSAGPASAMWELIPYSFVLDWFVNLAPYIDRVDNALTGSSKKLIDGCVSEKWSCQMMSRYNSYDLPQENAAASRFGRDAGYAELAYYHREPVDLKFVMGSSDRFGKKQFSLLLALFHQIVANLR